MTFALVRSIVWPPAWLSHARAKEMCDSLVKDLGYLWLK